MTTRLAGFLMGMTMAAGVAAADGGADDKDPNQWLEDVGGDKPLA